MFFGKWSFIQTLSVNEVLQLFYGKITQLLKTLYFVYIYVKTSKTKMELGDGRREEKKEEWK